MRKTAPVNGVTVEASPSQPSLLIVDDDSMVRGWVRLALDGTEFRVIGEATTAAAARELVTRRRPDLLLVDYHLPDGVGIELVRELRSSAAAVTAVVMTANPQPGFNDRAREAGARGTTLKTGRADDLLETLRAVAAGDTAFDARHPPRAPGRAALSPREREVLRLVAAGSTNKQIAAALSVSDETVKTLVSRTLAKLGARKRAEAVAEAHKLGLL